VNFLLNFVLVGPKRARKVNDGLSLPLYRGVRRLLSQGSFILRFLVSVSQDIEERRAVSKYYYYYYYYYYYIALVDTGLEVNAERTKYVLMSRHQNTGQNQTLR
jgi:hypothetical protein